MRRTTIITIALLAALTACSSVTRDKLSQLQPGVTTRAQAEAIMGPPNSISDRGGQILLQWIDAKPLGGGHVAVLFAREAPQRMVRVTHQSFTN